ncbi:MAG: hypothetical protein K2I07_15320 [Lachnospiraceae bacterium]|nr:hypothetical protein [Lachnospiraceae bacterium]
MQCKVFSPGEWVEKDVLGKQITFDEITQEIGNLIAISQSTCSRDMYKVVKVEEIRPARDGWDRQLVYFDGHKQRGFIREHYFNETKATNFPARAYRLAT